LGVTIPVGSYPLCWQCYSRY